MPAQTATVMKPSQYVAESRTVVLKDNPNRVGELTELIARHAFDIFEHRGQLHGHDLDDWLRAEADLFHGVHLHLYESQDSLIVEAEVPGFRSDRLEVTVEPQRVIITGKRASNGSTGRKVVYCDACPDRIFRALVLPVEVEPNSATASLKDGMLQVTLPKAITRRANAYALVRAEDSLLWTSSELLRRPE